jgi:hypothetical protein
MGCEDVALRPLEEGHVPGTGEPGVELREGGGVERDDEHTQKLPVPVTVLGLQPAGEVEVQLLRDAADDEPADEHVRPADDRPNIVPVGKALVGRGKADACRGGAAVGPEQPHRLQLRARLEDLAEARVQRLVVSGSPPGASVTNHSTWSRSARLPPIILSACSAIVCAARSISDARRSAVVVQRSHPVAARSAAAPTRSASESRMITRRCELSAGGVTTDGTVAEEGAGIRSVQLQSGK